MEYLISVIISISLFFYYTSAIGLYSRNVVFNWWDKFTFLLLFIVVFIPYLNLTFYIPILSITIFLGLLVLYRKMKD